MKLSELFEGEIVPFKGKDYKANLAAHNIAKNKFDRAMTKHSPEELTKHLQNDDVKIIDDFGNVDWHKLNEHYQTHRRW